MPIQPCLLPYLMQKTLHALLYNLLLFMLESCCCGGGLCGGDRCVRGDRGESATFPILTFIQIRLVHQLHPVLELLLVQQLSEPECR